MLLRSLDQIKNVKFGLLICDEGHRLKNSAIKTTAALISLSCEKRVILTGQYFWEDMIEFFPTYHIRFVICLASKELVVLDGIHTNKSMVIESW